MAGGIEKLAKQLGELVEANARMVFDAWSEAIESPIERILFVGLCSAVENGGSGSFHLVALSDGRQPMSEAAFKMSNEYGSLLIQFQVNLIDWRADFVLSAPWLTDRKIIIECDGHDFHERTKEQAARDRSRDRSATAAGYRMLRFTGSELYRDPLKCVDEALEQAEWLCGDR